MPKCSGVTFEIQTAARKTTKHEIHCDMESFSAFLISQTLSDSAPSVDFFLHHPWIKIIVSCAKDNMQM